MDIFLKNMSEELKNHFGVSYISFEKVQQWRSNLNYFLKIGEKDYFLRTSASKVKDDLFWWQIEKEKLLLESLWPQWLTPQLEYVYKDSSIIALLIERIHGSTQKFFHTDNQFMFQLLKKLQLFDKQKVSFLEEISILWGYKKIIYWRISNISDISQRKVSEKLFDFLFLKNWNFQEKLVLAHNDFRADNIIITWEKAYLIDLEWMAFSDEYLDLGEYYVWGIFWDTFDDEKEFSYENYTNFMKNFGFQNQEKLLYIFILKFTSNFCWLASHLSLNHSNLDKMYYYTMQRNLKLFSDNIEKIL